MQNYTYLHLEKGNILPTWNNRKINKKLMLQADKAAFTSTRLECTSSFKLAIRIAWHKQKD